MVLLDSDILIESLRGSIAAKQWLETLDQEVIAIPGVVAMELVIGCRNQNELQQLQKFLEFLSIVWPEGAEFEHSYQLLLSYRLSLALSIPDALIAAMALSRGARLYTFNLKHFQRIVGLDVQQPYQRS